MPRSRCSWTIEADPSHRIVLVVPRLRMKCSQGEVTLLDGPFYYSRSCHDGNLTHVSSSNHLTLVYDTGGEAKPASFEGCYHTYSADILVPTEEPLTAPAYSTGALGCGGLLTKPSGKITTSNAFNHECMWTIRLAPPLKILMTFPELRLNCETETLLIFNSNMFGYICELDSTTFRIPSNSVNILYNGSRNFFTTLFEASYHGILEDHSKFSLPSCPVTGSRTLKRRPA
ncbi:deleted in malignant brain tumors 1 protein-like [Echinops telfairi]|uniref:Deleted in malignant brain tumors 1 protein-like n=1 Tax=Echinops telfairi TaxID=9371 RepID=A0AC55D663_ECHTE|nr:deleted in malignant brain tumors 1 protein-like [Echinops telfairi]